MRGATGELDDEAAAVYEGIGTAGERRGKDTAYLLHHVRADDEHGDDAKVIGIYRSATSKQQLAAMVFGRDVQGQMTTTDRYGRSVARLLRGDLDANAEMVRRGAAWRYIQYSADPAFAGYEFEARMNKRGLWALQADQRIPTWDWRKGARRHPAGYREGQMIVVDAAPGPAQREAPASGGVRHEAILQPDGVMRGGKALSARLRHHVARRQRGWPAVLAIVRALAPTGLATHYRRRSIPELPRDSAVAFTTITLVRTDRVAPGGVSR